MFFNYIYRELKGKKKKKDKKTTDTNIINNEKKFKYSHPKNE